MTKQTLDKSIFPEDIEWNGKKLRKKVFADKQEEKWHVLSCCYSQEADSDLAGFIVIKEPSTPLTD